jgi:hypothetical protein
VRGKLAFAAALLLAGIFLCSAASAQCPAFGADTGCAAVITITPAGGSVALSGQAPYDGSDDTLVGVVNNIPACTQGQNLQCGVSINSLNLTSTLDIFGFDGDGIDTYGAPGNDMDNTGYGGPNTYFANVNPAQTTGTVNFITPIPPGGTTYFSLENVIANNAVTVSAINGSGNLFGATNLLAAVLPSSRSVQVDGTATVFATIINTAATTATSCSIAVAGSLPAAFVYQTTNSATNALTGTANTPVDIPGNGSQSFVLALTPIAAFAPVNAAFNFACTNTSPAPINIGLNTLLLSGSTTPVPDVVALAASGDPGIVDIAGANGTGAFAVATVNLGAGTTITASANTGIATLPVTLTICQTVPATGQCMAAPAASVTTKFQPNATPTFGIFATGSGSVSFDPANNRVFVQFADPSGTVRGETSVAVRTQ